MCFLCESACRSCLADEKFGGRPMENVATHAFWRPWPPLILFPGTTVARQVHTHRARTVVPCGPRLLARSILCVRESYTSGTKGQPTPAAEDQHTPTPRGHAGAKRRL